MIMSFFKRIFGRMSRIYSRSNSDHFCKYLRNKGIRVGDGCHFDPKTTHIDMTRPSLISIGDNCYMNRGFTILTHDWVTHVFIHSGKEFVNSSGHVTIGNNVGFGENVTVLKGVRIGDNCFIGAGSVVSTDIPSGSVAVGYPCKVVRTLDEYYEKRKEVSEEEAFEYARSIVSRFHRQPVVEDFWEEFPFFVSGDEIEKYPTLPIARQLGPSLDGYRKNHKAKYRSFEEFLKAAGIYDEK